MEDLIRRQYDREKQSVEHGQAKYRHTHNHPDKKSKYNPMLSKPELCAMTRHIECFADGLRVEFPEERVQFSKQHRTWSAEFKSKVIEILNKVSYEEVAFITLRYAIRNLYNTENRMNYAVVAGPAADEVLMQYHYHLFHEANPQYVDAIIERRRSENPDHLHTVLTLKRHQNGIQDMDLDVNAKVLFGGLLLHILCDTTKLFRWVDVMDHDKKCVTRALSPAPEFMDWLEREHDKWSVLQPVDVPMVCKPEPWTGPFSGGFLSNNDRAKRHSVGRHRNPELRLSFFERTSTEVIEAIQALQDVPWSINSRVLDIIKAVAKLANGLGGVPMVPKELNLPSEPWLGTGMTPEEFAQNEPENFKKWKMARTMEYTRFHNGASARTTFTVMRGVAEEFEKEERFYFCYNMDWRGRIYTLQNCGLTPQGDDISKALLQFADAKPLGPRGLFWLGVHLANSFGFDKASFEERYAWTQEHHRDILAAAESPLDVKWWADADKPYLFLAACFEWAAAHELADPTTFESRLPIGMDASCSGSQHFSALLRDPVGGKAVNLVPGEKPSDIYALVAAESVKIMEADQTPEGAAWLRIEGGFNRKWTKRNTMTMPYSASLYGFTDQIAEELMKEQRKHGKSVLPAPQDTAQGKWDFACARYLATTNRQAISKVVVKMFAAMEWLRNVADIVGKVGADIEWTTPIGLKVVQRYRKYSTKRLGLWFGVINYKPTITDETDKPNVEGHKNGISPNFIHSLDAAHLMKVAQVFAAGHRKSLAVVHDSFSTHACDVNLMRDVVRNEFVKMYAGTDLIRDLYDGLRDKHPTLDIPEPPTQGDLDVALVEESDYFIS
jgi:DNA-directed RNA polymerase